MAWITRGWRFRPRDHAPHAWGRLGAFVDGVYAIAATLLVIELRPPEDAEPGQLGAEVLHLAPQYWAYVIGFVQMIAGWLQSRRLDAWMRGVDHYATLLVLVSVGVYALTPFSTVVLASALRSGDRHDLGTAVRLMAILLLVALIAFALLLLYSRWAGLLRADVEPAALSLYLRTAVLVVPVVPLLAFAVSYGEPWLGLVLIVGLNLLGLLPLESHQPPAGAERGPRPATRRRRRGPR
ncbi:MAG TPA: TMEM175 family protein [Mycobacteriales bacterium]|nr:TMEM175 family protein [Mycobacteriales bacterium]